MWKRLLLWSTASLSFLMAQQPGAYLGTWTSAANGGGGKLTVSFTADTLDAASFTYQGQEVKAKSVSSKRDGENVVFVFEYTLGDSILRTQMQGSITPQALKGKYKSTSADGSTPVDEGSWEVTRKQ